MEIREFPFSKGKGLLIEGSLWTEAVYIADFQNEVYLIADDVVEINQVEGNYSSAFYGKKLNKSLWFDLRSTSFSERYYKPEGVDNTHGMALHLTKEVDEIMKPETKWEAFKNWCFKQAKNIRMV